MRRKTKKTKEHSGKIGGLRPKKAGKSGGNVAGGGRAFQK